MHWLTNVGWYYANLYVAIISQIDELIWVIRNSALYGYYPILNGVTNYIEITAWQGNTAQFMLAHVNMECDNHPDFRKWV